MVHDHAPRVTRRSFVRTAAVFAGGLVGLPLLQACNQAAPATPAAQPTTATKPAEAKPTAASQSASATPKPAPAAAGAPSGVKGATVNYLVIPTFEKTAREAAQEYTELYGAKVELSIQPTLQLRDKLLTEYVAKTGAFDIVNISPWWLGDFGPYLEPLEKYLTDQAVAMPDFDFADYDPEMLKAYTTFEGKLVGLPYHADHMMLLYRTDLFENPKEKDAFKAKYGTELAVPKTWEEFDKVAEFFTRPDQGLWGHAVMGKRTHQSGAQWINRFFGNGGKYFDDKGAPTINSDAGVKSMEHLATIGKKFGPEGYLTHEFPEARQAFWEGKAAMVEAWPGTVVVGGQDPKQSKIVGKINGVVMPGGHGCGGGWFIAVSGDSKNKVAAYKWLELSTSKKYVQKAYQNDGTMPGRQSPYKEEYIAKTLPPGFSEQFGLAFARSFPPPNRFPEDSELKNELDRYVSEAMAGLKPPKQAIDDAQKSWETILKRAGRI